MVDLEQFARHSPYSDPGRHAERLGDVTVAVEVDTACAVARNVIGHYRAELPDLPVERRGEIDSRWLETILDVDAARHPASLDEPRPLSERVAGCCRDHTLFVVGALRQLGVPARSRVGFADYLSPGWSYDHVVVQFWADGEWRWVDPEFPHGGWRLESAAQAWTAYRAGDRDLAHHGVFPGSEFSGRGFVRDEVFYELAHRYGDETLLWDEWGALADPETDPQTTDEFVDELARLLLAADAGDEGAEAELHARYVEDDRLHPGDTVVVHSPYGDPGRVVALRR